MARGIFHMIFPPGARRGPGRRLWPLLFVCALSALPATGQEAREFRLAVAPEVADTGLIQHILPRFMLKTGRRGQPVPPGDMADIVIGPAPEAPGQAVMQRAGVVYRMHLATGNDAARRFADWLGSEIGQNTLAAYAPPDGPPFAPAPREAEVAQPVIAGDPVLGRRVAERHCARCHRIHPEGRGIGIGSTPSFAALRSLPDWADRFAAFYALNPHPAFLRVEGISPAFDISRPPPIVPVLISLDEAEAVQAYVAGLAPADLGPPVAAQ